MRSIQITPRIQELLKAHLGGDAPASDQITVFEATAVSTLPLRKKGSIFDKAVLSRSALVEMASQLKAGNQIPFHTLHKSESELPRGRVFHAEVIDQGDKSELRALFYLPNTEAKMISDIETGVLQAVSVGMLHKQLLCSECGWDYRGKDASLLNFYDRTCANGHVIGENGVHLNCVGTESWLELSAVGRGASRDANIVSRAKAKLQETGAFERLAASGMTLEALLATHQTEDPKMDKEFLARFEAQTSELATTKASVTDLTAKLTAANAEVETLKKAAEGHSGVVAKLADAEKTIETMKGTETGALAFLQEQVTKALVAAGQKDPKAPNTIAECIAALKEAGKNLVNLLAGAGKTIAADASDEGRKAPSTNDAFKTRK